MSDTEEMEVDLADLMQILQLNDREANEQGPSKTHRPEAPAQGAFFDLLTILGLDEYYPSKISLYDAMVIKKFTKHPRLVDLPWMIIRKLLAIDFHARDHLFLVVQPSADRHIADDECIDLEFFLDLGGTSRGNDQATQLNTLDVLVAIFTCCDNFLKQTLAQKLFVCKLAIPFLYPLGSEGDIVMSLWALRTITVQWLTEHKKVTETPVTDYPFPIVTFVRLGRPPQSKSKLINEILRDESHDTFFNYDCNNGTVARRLTDGLVECSWFITAGKEKEHLPGTTMLLNLRGDAASMKKEMQILQEISSVMFIIVTGQDLARNPNISSCKQILKASKKVILFLISGNNRQSIHELNAERRACVEAVGRDSLMNIPIISSVTRRGIQKNVSELKTEARQQLSEVISVCPTGMMLKECAQLAEKKGIIIDEYADEDSLECKVLAEKVVGHMKNTAIVDFKRLLLPLQGPEWIKYCTLLKEQHRASQKSSHFTLAEQADHIRQKMDSVREKQVEMCGKRLSPFIRDFLSVLQNHICNQDITFYFLNWIKILLDETSRANLTDLRRNYHTLWNQFQLSKKKQEEANMGQLKSVVDVAEINLANASLGLENLFRELGQIYEAIKESKRIGEEDSMLVEYLPELAAKLLMKGSPLELVDGDASSVPILWVSAVLSKLGGIIDKKRLFVLSVLGIQSSGKSTLLNTMFGLQLAVSAGRCTRGAYMHLIPVDDHAELPFDYIVVVDTEGLRAPELGQLKFQHDNELATLVIGLGDVTILNIKGENTAEMKDILQIAVHAFLRMKLVSRHINDTRNCIFVHQNVPVSNAEELMMHGCQKLQEELDDMTKEAARSENIANIHSFSQIINFDVQKHVWYFSDLWHGNPPMAPANPGYSEKVEAVKLSLLEGIAKKKTSFLTTSDLSIRLADLWNGVLAENFVFSFRNSLEVKAYNDLQSTYYTQEWELQNELITFLQNAEIKLKMSEEICDLEKSFNFLIINLCNVLTEKAREIKTFLKNYFKNNNLKEIIIQWEQSKINQLNFAVEQQNNEGKAELLSVKETRQLEILQYQKLANHEFSIMSKAVQLAHKLKGQKVTDAELENKFGAMWVTMVNELVTNSADKESNIDQHMYYILCQRFHAHEKFLKDELERHPLDVPLEQKALPGSITLNDVRKHHISLKTTLWEDFKKSTGISNPELQARHKTVALTDSIFQEISTYLKDVSRQQMKFKKSNATDVIQMLVREIESYNQNAYVSDDCTFTILPEYVIKVAVHVSRHCFHVFSLMQIEYNRKHGVKAKLEDYKKTAWSLFKNMVNQSTEEVIAGDLLCTTVMEIIYKAVKKDVLRKCIDEVVRDFQNTKYYLIIKMMDYLACKKSFKEYEAYINNAKEFALWWITQYTHEKMFSKQDGSDMSRYAEIAKSNIGRIITCVAKSVEHATGEVRGQGGITTALWIQKFCQRASQEIAVPVSALRHVSARQVVDFGHLQRIILDHLERSVKANLVNIFENETIDSFIWDGPQPPQQILDKIWGCPEQCPFCQEPCADTTAGHYSQYGRSHWCVQHRPVGIGGIRWRKDQIVGNVNTRTDQLIHYTCNYNVQLHDLNFDCESCKLKCKDSGKCTITDITCAQHKFLNYKTYLPSWDIAPDRTNNVSKYWSWFMTTYQRQLKFLYKAKLPNIPMSWKSITREDALADLRKIHS